MARYLYWMFWQPALAAALLVPGLAGAQVSGDKKPVRTESRSFKIPVRLSDDLRGSLREIQLFVKTPSSDWKHHATVEPDATDFRCYIATDGEYWFGVVTVSKDAKQLPAELNDVVDVLRVIVDTKQATPQPGGVVAQPAEPRSGPPRFTFKIDANEPLSELVPAAPKTPAKLPTWTNEDLAKVRELALADPIAKDLGKMKAVEKTAHILAKINHLNRKKTDGFMLALLEQRGDLRGLPFLMGEECRTREEQAKAFHEIADEVNRQLFQCKVNPNANPNAPPPPAFGAVPKSAADQLWITMSVLSNSIQRGNAKGAGVGTTNRDHLNRAMVAALTQILMPEAVQYRAGLAKFLATVPHPDATKALARLAIFSPEDEVRAAAIEGLKTRREKDYTDILMSGFTYPLPAVSKRAAEALVKLERKDLLENLVRVLESPDPRLPVKVKDATLVRELVKVNHHRNCVLCHAPGNTENMPEGVLTVAVPLPGEPLPRPSQGGYQSTPSPSPDIVVRIDMTYLRQDFSVMMPVANPEPWPEMQRFDFLVRTRTLTAVEAKAYEPCCAEEEPGRLSPYHRAALFALRELTGRDTEPTAAAWRKLLKLPR